MIIKATRYTAFNLRSLGVSGRDDDGSAGLAMVALINISGRSLSAVIVLSLKGSRVCRVVGSVMPLLALKLLMLMYWLIII